MSDVCTLEGGIKKFLGFEAIRSANVELNNKFGKKLFARRKSQRFMLTKKLLGNSEIP